MWSDLTARHRHSRAQTRRQRCYQSLHGDHWSLGQLPRDAWFSVLVFLISCILFFSFWTEGNFQYGSPLYLCQDQINLPCNLQMIKSTIFCQNWQLKKALSHHRFIYLSSYTWTSAAQLWVLSTAVRNKQRCCPYGVWLQSRDIERVQSLKSWADFTCCFVSFHRDNTVWLQLDLAEGREESSPRVVVIQKQTWISCGCMDLDGHCCRQLVSNQLSATAEGPFKGPHRSVQHINVEQTCGCWQTIIPTAKCATHAKLVETTAETLKWNGGLTLTDLTSARYTLERSLVPTNNQIICPWHPVGVDVSQQPVQVTTLQTDIV